MIQMKACAICKKSKSFEEYNKGCGKYKLDNRCKACKKLLYKQHRISILEKKKFDYHENGGREREVATASTLEGYLKRLARLNVKDRRELDWTVLLELWEEQEGLCAITHSSMTHIAGKGRQRDNVSIDRIDSSLGYTKDNIQLVRYAVNMMKHELSMEEFIELAREVVDGSSKKKKE